MIYDHREPNRKPATVVQRLNPLWWMSDEERNPAWPQIRGLNWLLWLPGLRWVCWFTRNPFCNLASVILGIAHCSRMVAYAKGDGWTFAEQGWNYGWVRADGSSWRLWFISYRGRWIECKIGWETNGALAILPTLRKAHSKNAD